MHPKLQRQLRLGRGLSGWRSLLLHVLGRCPAELPRNVGAGAWRPRGLSDCCERSAHLANNSSFFGLGVLECRSRAGHACCCPQLTAQDEGGLKASVERPTPEWGVLLQVTPPLSLALRVEPSEPLANPTRTQLGPSLWALGLGCRLQEWAE